MTRSLSLITVIVLSLEWLSTVVPLNGHEVQSNRGRNLMTGGLISLSNKVAKPAIVVIAAVAMVLSASVVALADSHRNVSFDGHLRGQASFVSEGDWFRICDKRQDNLPVAVRFSYIRENGSTQRGTHWHTAGVDGSGNRGPLGRTRGCSYGNHNFGEHRRVWFQACVQHAGGNLTRSSTQVTPA
jgi:hypothetical protein